MQTHLTIGEILKDLRIEKGYNLEQLAEETGISSSTLSAYESDETREIGHSNLLRLAKYYDISVEYLLGIIEDRQPYSLNINKLHLTKDAMTVLENSHFNHKLLSEILTDKNFLRLMVDLEIYVDGAVTYAIKQYNRTLELSRRMLLKKADPDKYDLNLNILQQAQINDDDYYAHVLSHDLMSIIENIRNRHRNDSGTLDRKTDIDVSTDNLMDAVTDKNTLPSKFNHIIKNILGLKDKDISPEDQKVISKLMNKSKFLKPKTDQRKKK